VPNRRSRSNRSRVLLTILAVGAFAFSLFIAITGGVTTYILGLRASSHRPLPALAIGWIALLLAFGTDRVGVQLVRAGELLEKHSRAAAIGLTVITLLVGVLFGAFTAAGADPYGYVSQATLWTRGSVLQPQHPLAREAPWANAAWSFSPLGYVPSADLAHIAPAYPVGLPLQMALAMKVGGMSAGYSVVPILGALAVWLTFLLGRRASRSGYALAAALLVACSPVFLFQLVQPMTDVPVTMWWLAATWAASFGRVSGSVGAGLAASIALVTRPNLALLLLPVSAYVWMSAGLKTRWKAIGAFVIAVVPGFAVSAFVNDMLFGSPLRSGYGGLSEIFTLQTCLRTCGATPHGPYKRTPRSSFSRFSHRFWDLRQACSSEPLGSLSLLRCCCSPPMSSIRRSIIGHTCDFSFRPRRHYFSQLYQRSIDSWGVGNGSARSHLPP
jgi:hypothetical protein